MRALTVQRPWDYALLNGKPIENRPLKPPAHLIGVRIALHAGIAYDYERAPLIKQALGVTELPSTQGGVIFATTTIIGYVERDTDACRRNGVQWLASAPELGWALESPWFLGPYGYVLRDTRALAKPIGARGMQGWWPVPTEIERRVLAQLEAAA